MTTDAVYMIYVGSGLEEALEAMKVRCEQQPKYYALCYVLYYIYYDIVYRCEQQTKEYGILGKTTHKMTSNPSE